MKKEKFEFYQALKVAIWKRRIFTIEADTREEAIEKAKVYADSDVLFNDELGVEVEHPAEYLEYTEEILKPEKIVGHDTIRVYACMSGCNPQLIANNIHDKIQRTFIYSIRDEKFELPEGIFPDTNFRSKEDARKYLEFMNLKGIILEVIFDGDIEKLDFVTPRYLKKGERVFNDEQCEGNPDLRDWATVCEDTAVLYDDQIVLLNMENGGENETDAASVYQIAEGRVCPRCDGPLCVEHNVEAYSYYCPECNENFYSIEVI